MEQLDGVKVEEVNQIFKNAISHVEALYEQNAKKTKASSYALPSRVEKGGILTDIDIKRIGYIVKSIVDESIGESIGNGFSLSATL